MSKLYAVYDMKYYEQCIASNDAAILLLGKTENRDSDTCVPMFTAILFIVERYK